MDAIIGVIISVINLLIVPGKAIWQFLEKKRAKNTKSLEHITGGFDTPNENEVVGRRVECTGWINGNSKNQHFWLAAVVDDLFWPKEGQIVIKDGRWKKIVHEDGNPPNGKFAIAIYATNEDGHNNILSWIEETRRTGYFYGLSDVNGVRKIETIELYVTGKLKRSGKQKSLL